MNEFSAALQKRRKELGLTQAALAKFAGCSTVFIVQLESGKQTIQLHKLLAVLKILGLQLRLEQGKAQLVVDETLAR